MWRGRGTLPVTEARSKAFEVLQRSGCILGHLHCVARVVQGLDHHVQDQLIVVEEEDIARHSLTVPRQTGSPTGFESTSAST